MNEYRGIVYLGETNKVFRDKVDNFHKWCEKFGLNPEDDEVWNSYCEANHA